MSSGLISGDLVFSFCSGDLIYFFILLDGIYLCLHIEIEFGYSFHSLPLRGAGKTCVICTRKDPFQLFLTEPGPFFGIAVALWGLPKTVGTIIQGFQVVGVCSHRLAQTHSLLRDCSGVMGFHGSQELVHPDLQLCPHLVLLDLTCPLWATAELWASNAANG